MLPVLTSDFSVLTSSAAPLKPGAGSLRFESVRGSTALTRAEATSPLRLLNPKNAGRSSWVYAATYGGGLVGGDSLDVAVDVGPGAAALVATQASTKVYRSTLGARQRLQASAAEGSLLVLLPDPVTVFAGARYAQEQHVALDGTASLVLVDWLTAGRMASGERWQFDGYTNRTSVCRAGTPLLLDAVSLSPEDGSVNDRLNRFNCLATAVLTGPLLGPAATRLLGELSSAPLSRRSDLLTSAAPLAGGDDGVVVRLAGLSVEQVGSALRQFLSVVPALLGDDPWACKH